MDIAIIKKISEKLKGRVSPNKGKKHPEMSGDKHHAWNENAGYIRKHSFIERLLGKPRKCEHCGADNLRPRQYNWANIDHKYSRNIKDWIRLCVRCHHKFDEKNNGYVLGRPKKKLEKCSVCNSLVIYIVKGKCNRCYKREWKRDKKLS